MPEEFPKDYKLQHGRLTVNLTKDQMDTIYDTLEDEFNRVPNSRKQMIWDIMERIKFIVDFKEE